MTKSFSAFGLFVVWTEVQPDAIVTPYRGIDVAPSACSCVACEGEREDLREWFAEEFVSNRCGGCNETGHADDACPYYDPDEGGTPSPAVDEQSPLIEDKPRCEDACDDDRTRYTCDGSSKNCLGLVYTDSRVNHADCCVEIGGVWDHRLTLCSACNGGSKASLTTDEQSWESQTGQPASDMPDLDTETCRLCGEEVYDGMMPRHAAKDHSVSPAEAVVLCGGSHVCEDFRLSDGDCEVCWLSRK